MLSALILGLSAFSLVSAQGISDSYDTVTTTTPAEACTSNTPDPNASITSYSTSVIWECLPATTLPPVTPVTPITPNPTLTKTKTKTVTDIFTTIYITTYINVCPTGTYIATYTITDTCPGSASDYTRPTTAPPGFTVDIKTCSAEAKGACPTGNGGKVIVTEPCGCTKTGMDATIKELWPTATGTAATVKPSATGTNGWNGENEGPLLTGAASGRVGSGGVAGWLIASAMAVVAGVMFVL